MHLNAKKISFLGLLLAFTVILVVLSGIIEMNTLFLLAAASFGVGIAIRECGLRLGLGFYIAAVLLSFILAPNKIYCITFLAMGLYLVIVEFTWEKLGAAPVGKHRRKIFWMVKYLTFNIMYIPMLIFLPKLIYEGDISTVILGGLIAAGQIALFIYDMAYNYFQKSVWGKVRGNLLKS